MICCANRRQEFDLVFPRHLCNFSRMGHVVNFSKQINKPACWRNPEERRCVGTGVVENAMRNSHRHAHKVAGSGVVKLAMDKQVKFTCQDLNIFILCGMDVWRHKAA